VNAVKREGLGKRFGSLQVRNIMEAQHDVCRGEAD
jgi:hypothetical protein